jgi:DNA-binding NarL/FixJ family response regulator
MADSIRVVVVDDHQVARHGLHSFLNAFPDLEILLSSIRAAARGQSLLDPTVASVVMHELSHIGQPGVDLTSANKTCCVSWPWAVPTMKSPSPSRSATRPSRRI